MRFDAGYLFRLSVADLIDEWPVAFAMSLAIVAAMTPLLVLNGLEAGVVGEIFERLRKNPAMRLVTLDATGSKRFDEGWFERVRGWPEVAFVMPATRYSSGQVDVSPAGRLDVEPERVTLLPTGPGDPVFGDEAPALATAGEARVSAVIGERLGLKPGDDLLVRFERRGNQPATVTLRAVAIAEPAGYRGEAIFVQPRLMREIEAFRDGAASPQFGYPEGEDYGERQYFPNFRLYARSIGIVDALAKRLRAEEDLSVSTRWSDIVGPLELKTDIETVLRAILVVAGLGLAGSLTAIQWAMATRKRRVIAMLSLIGFDRRWLVGFPLCQALVVGVLGASLATLMALAAAAWINTYFAPSFGSSGQACVIGPGLVAVAFVAVLILSFAPASWIGARFAALEPGDEIRDV